MNLTERDSQSINIVDVGKYIRTHEKLILKLTTPIANAEMYSWTLPQGVEKTLMSDNTCIYVDFYSIFEGITSLTFTVKGTNTAGTIVYGTRSLKVSAKVPVTPTKLTLTTLNNSSPISDVTSYIGTDTQLKLALTMPDIHSANSYCWTLPSGVTRTGGDTSNTTDPYIIVTFAGVDEGTSALLFSAFALNDVGSSNPKYLNLKISLKMLVTPTTLTIADWEEASPPIGNLINYVGNSYAKIKLKLTMPETEANSTYSYFWALPSGVTRVDNTTNISTDPYIIATLNSVDEGTSALLFSVFAFNGVRFSNRKYLNVPMKVPNTPNTLTLQDGDLIISDITSYIGTNTQLILSIPETYSANSYYWALPSGVTRTDDASESNISTFPYIYVNFANVFTGTITLTFSVKAKNIVGFSNPRSLNIISRKL